MYALSVELLLDVRSMEDVHKSWVYQTAAKTTRLDIYVDTEQTRDVILSFANSQSLQQQLPTAQLPEQGVPYAVPVAQVTLSTSDSSSRDTSATNLKLLIEESFQALADAQEAVDRHSGSVDDALEKYRAADQGFERAARLVSDERTRQLFQERRQEIQRVICRLEGTLETQKRRQQPSASETLLMGITGMGFPDAPLHTVTTTAASSGQGTASAPDSATISTIVNSSPATTSELDERLERLKNFAAQQEVERAQREHKPASEDLRLRLQALRNENHTTPSVESLEERFQRLRGGGSNGNALNTSSPGEGEEEDAEKLFNRQSSVDRIIQQVQEEIALGIPDDELEQDEGSERESQSSESESDGDDEGSDDDSTDDQQRRKENGRASSVRKSRC